MIKLILCCLLCIFSSLSLSNWDDDYELALKKVQIIVPMFSKSGEFLEIDRDTFHIYYRNNSSKKYTEEYTYLRNGQCLSSAKVVNTWRQYNLLARLKDIEESHENNKLRREKLISEQYEGFKELSSFEFETKRGDSVYFDLNAGLFKYRKVKGIPVKVNELTSEHGFSLDPGHIEKLFVSYLSHKNSKLQAPDTSASRRRSILPSEGYDIIKSAEYGESIPLNTIYKYADDFQKSLLIKNFDFNDNVTREDILMYVRRQVEDDALLVLRGKENRHMSRKKLLKDMHAAMSGHFERDGVLVTFKPDLKDYRLLINSYRRNDLKDPRTSNFLAYLKNSQGLRPSYDDIKFEYSSAELNIFTNEIAAEIEKNHLNSDQTASKDEKALILQLRSFKGLSYSKKELLFDILFSNFRPSLYENETYRRIMLAYYQSKSLDEQWVNMGNPKIDWKSDRLIFDKNGFSVWDGGVGEAYGGMHIDQYLSLYLFYNRNSLSKDFGERIASNFVKTQCGKSVVTYNLSFTKADNALAAIPDGKTLIDDFRTSLPAMGERANLVTLYYFIPELYTGVDPVFATLYR